MCTSQTGSLGRLYGCGVGVVCGVVDGKGCSIGEIDFVNDAGGGGYKVEIIFSFKAFLDDFHVQQTEKSAAETESQSRRGFRLEMKRRVVELKLFESLAKVGILCSVGGINAAENHRIDGSVALERLACRVLGTGYGVAHPRLADGFLSEAVK